MAIDVRNVSKSFNGFKALDDVSLSVPDGSLTALLGPSGGGKSTLLRVLAGLERPDGGEVLFSGESVTSLPAEQRGVGFVFQHYAAFKHMTVRDNIAFGLKIRKRPKTEIRERVDFRVAAEVGVALVVERRHGGAVRQHRAERVRLQVEVDRALGRGEAHQGGRRRQLVETAAPPRTGHQVEVRHFVLPSHHAPQVHAPRLAAFPEADRAEGHAHFDRPATVEVGGLRPPQPVPVGTGLLVRGSPVEHAAKPVGREAEAVALIVEGVEQYRQVVVVVHVERVAPHLALHAAAGLGFVEARGDVDVLVVEEDPGFGLLGRGRPFVGLLLEEVGQRRHGGVHGFGERAVDHEVARDSRGPDGRVPRVVAHHHR